MKTMVQPAHVSAIAEVTLAGTVASGQAADFGSSVGIHQKGGESGNKDAVHFGGIHRVTKATGTAWAVGDSIYLNADNVTFSTVSAGNNKAGMAAAAAASGDAEGLVMLIPQG